MHRPVAVALAIRSLVTAALNSTIPGGATIPPLLSADRAPESGGSETAA